MNEPDRLIPSWPLPEYVFIPGVNPHPKKEGGHMEGQDDPMALPLDVNHPEESKFLRYALDLFNYEYYWESHVYFEALWNAHARRGSVADFLKAMIKLGAAGVKLKINQRASALDHFLRAKELFLLVEINEGTLFLGFNLKEIIREIDLVLEADTPRLIIQPVWK